MRIGKFLFAFSLVTILGESLRDDSSWGHMMVQPGFLLLWLNMLSSQLYINLLNFCLICDGDFILHFRLWETLAERCADFCPYRLH